MSSAFNKLKKNSGKGKEAFEKLTKKSGYSNTFYMPETNKEGIGEAKIRFLPAPYEGDEPTPMFVEVYQHATKVGGKWSFYNCPTTIGEDCEVCSANSEVWTRGGEDNENWVRKRKRQQSFRCNILVIEDKANPDNEGKVFRFKYGSQIQKKIEVAYNPKYESQTPFDPFDMFETGANFILRIEPKSENGKKSGFPTYENSEFEPCSALFDGNEKKIEAIWEQCTNLEKEFLDTATYTKDPKPFMKACGYFEKGAVGNDEAEDAPAPSKTSAPRKEKESVPDMAEEVGSADDSDAEEYFKKVAAGEV